MAFGLTHGGWRAVSQAVGVKLLVPLVRRHLQRYQVRALRANVEDLVAMVDGGKVAWPRIVHGRLDSPQARCALQLLWPNRLIGDGWPECGPPGRRDEPLMRAIFGERHNNAGGNVDHHYREMTQEDPRGIADDWSELDEDPGDAAWGLDERVSRRSSV